MALTTKTFDGLVTEQATAIQGASSSFLVDFTIGSVPRAIVEAISAIAMWLQGMILQMLATTRASTSAGADLDSWVADYGLTRLPAVAATGLATFARFTPSAQAVVPVGAIVQTLDGAHRYVVIEDDVNTHWNAGIGGYVLLATVASIDVPVKALTPGTAANAVIGAINTLGQAIPGVDTVTNGSALVNGEDAESDAALRTRFQLYIASLSKATKSAVSYAVSATQQALTYAIVENEDYSGSAQMGYFYVVIDDGTGSPGSDLITAVTNAIDLVRPICSSFGVFGPITVTADIVMTIATASGYDHPTLVTQVSNAVTSYINALGLGVGLDWSRLFQIAYDVSPGVTNVTGVTVNSATSDLAASAKEVIRAGTVTVT